MEGAVIYGAQNAIRKARDGRGLDPDLPRTFQRGHEEAFSAKEHRFDALGHLDVVVDRRLEADDATRVDAQLLSALEQST